MATSHWQALSFHKFFHHTPDYISMTIPVLYFPALRLRKLSLRLLFQLGIQSIVDRTSFLVLGRLRLAAGAVGILAFCGPMLVSSLPQAPARGTTRAGANANLLTLLFTIVKFLCIVEALLAAWTTLTLCNSRWIWVASEWMANNCAWIPVLAGLPSLLLPHQQL